MHNKYPSVMAVAKRPGNLFVAGKGSWLTDANGERFLDFVQGWAVNSLGHSPDCIVEAVAKQSGKLVNCGPGFYNEKMVALAERLTAASVFDEVFFANSGAEANEGAIKLARKWGALHRGGAWKIITFDNGFHGRTLTTMAATGKPGWETLFEPKTPGFPKARFNDLDSVAACIDDETVAVMLEPIQGEAGVIPAEPDFLAGLRELTREHGLLLIFDEVQTGMGRTGSLFAYEQFGVEPDIMTLGKGIGGGLLLAALLTKREFSCFEPGDQGGTFNGNPLVCAAGLTVIEQLQQPGFLDAVRVKSEYLRQALERLSAEFALSGVRGRGLLLALDTVKKDAADIAAKAFDNRLLINAPRKNTLRFMPALNVGTEDIDEMIARLRKSLG